jgi:hypothetical protein
MQPQPKVDMTPAPTPASTPTGDPLEAVVEEIRGDAAREPAAYARETIVPEGGE